MSVYCFDGRQGKFSRRPRRLPESLSNAGADSPARTHSLDVCESLCSPPLPFTNAISEDAKDQARAQTRPPGPRSRRWFPKESARPVREGTWYSDKGVSLKCASGNDVVILYLLDQLRPRAERPAPRFHGYARKVWLVGSYETPSITAEITFDFFRHV